MLGGTVSMAKMFKALNIVQNLKTLLDLHKSYSAEC